MFGLSHGVKIWSKTGSMILESRGDFRNKIILQAIVRKED